VKEISVCFLNLGVVKKEFLLSSQPVEGNWKISVTAAKDQKAEQVFEVKPYGMPCVCCKCIFFSICCFGVNFGWSLHAVKADMQSNTFLRRKVIY